MIMVSKTCLYLFEGMTGLQANYAKTCLYSTRVGYLPDVSASSTLSCASGLLPVTYLGLPILGHRPRKQDWEGIIAKVHSRLSS